MEATTAQQSSDSSPEILKESSKTAHKLANTILKEPNKRKIQDYMDKLDIQSLTMKLNMMSQMPNNNIGLAMIFRRFRLMPIDQQKLFCQNIYIEYNGHFDQVFNQIAQMQQQLESQSETGTANSNQIQQNITIFSNQLIDILRLTRRLAYHCPIQHISDPFFMLYGQHKAKVQEISEYVKQFSQSEDELESSPKQKEQFVFIEKTDVDTPKNFRDEESIKNSKIESNVHEISQYLYYNPDKQDKLAELPETMNTPLKLIPNKKVGNQQFDYPFEVLRMKDEDVSETLSEVQDELWNNEIVDLYSIYSKIFLIDGRIYKHYRLLPWFPKYFESMYRSQLLIMDNNDLGEEQYMNQAENDIFPKHINYYLAIMAVSCYQNEYLLQILQEQFLLSGGPIEWLIFGLEKVDPKIKLIAELNEKMAYKPWIINKDDITFLVKGNPNWTMHEVIKACIILATYHGISGFCHGMGLIPDFDIVEELLSLMGQQALELIISKEQYAKSASGNIKLGGSQHGYAQGTEFEADVSSYTSRSQRSERDKVDRQFERLKKYDQKRQALEGNNTDYLSDDSSDIDEDPKVLDSDDEQFFELQKRLPKKLKKDEKKLSKQSKERAQETEYQAELKKIQNNLAKSQLEDDDEDIDIANFDPKADLNIKNKGASGKQKSLQPKNTGQKLSESKQKDFNDRMDSSQTTQKQSTKAETHDEESKTENTKDEQFDGMFEKHRIKKLKEYQDFNHKVNFYLNTYDFSWEVHGYDLFSKFLPITSKILSTQFNMAFTMTKRSYANKDLSIDTSDLRNALVYYLKGIHGIKDETFDYKKVNKLLEIDQKKFIKKVVCHPKDITQEDYDKLSDLFYDSEKCHICIICMETKKQVSLIYVARALSDFMS